MSDTAEVYKLIAERERIRKGERRDLAAAAFPDIRSRAEEHGLRLVRHTEAHYQLRPADGSWILNICPGNRRLYSDPKKVAPWLSVPVDWTLLDVVNAAIAAERKGDCN